MTPEQIKRILGDRVVTYAKIVADYRSQKSDPNCVRITAGGNLLKYPGELSTKVADFTTSKLLWNSVISTNKAKCMGIDIKNFYLGTPMDRVPHTPRLWKHATRPVQFTLVVDDYGAKYVGKEYGEHLMNCLKNAGVPAPN